MAETAGQERHIVIVGGGVIGATTAYFLTRHPKYNRALHRITILEASAIAAGASGKAGGLLALWAYPKELVPLSYRLHRQLAEEHNGAQRWGYRRVHCGHIQAEVTQDDLQRRAAEVKAAGDAKPAQTQAAEAKSEEDSPPTAAQNNHHHNNSSSNVMPLAATTQKEWEKLPKQDEHAASLLKPSPLPADLDWIDPAVVRAYDQMGVPGAYDTAQVHPFHFTTAMAALAEERGATVRLNALVTDIVTRDGKSCAKGSSSGSSSSSSSSSSSRNDDNDDVNGDARLPTGTAVQAVVYTDRTTGSTERIDGVTDVLVAAGPWTGVVLPQTKVEGLRAHSVVWRADVSPYAVFTDVGLPAGYVPAHRAAAGQKRRRHRGRVDPEIYARPFGECADLAAYVGTFSPVLAAAPLTATQACYLPRHMRFGDERGPLMGRTRTPGLWVAAGHTCWGIQNSAATGCLMAELLLDGKTTSADIAKLDPSRYRV
ncbi:FAD dependent oxidoreductase superfamily [Niveomyces insectorum RCEF 264]|uniref:FAD dependent oxidoreductase superfamily n=1 Tax=Niveomyces insectorum RCEF 264 TaxID=1081102 RepID=A0A168AGX0_9HYPO|nr:FAD dependent oxidoreductase superfamily [Niveomyces insectorum RCEF 264]